MSDVTVYYFDLTGLAEAIRLLLVYGGQKFNDVRFSKEEWPEYKSKMPFGTVPVVEMEGRQFAQSTAICRYLGKKYGLVGASPLEDFEIDQNVDYFNEFCIKVATVHYEPDEALKAKKVEESSKNVFPGYLKKIDEILAKNNGYIANGKLSWGDFVIGGVFSYLKMMLSVPDLEKDYPHFQKLLDNVYSIPQIKTYAASA